MAGFNDATWEHGIPDFMLPRLRNIVRPVSQPTALNGLELGVYARLRHFTPQEWEILLTRYSVFEKLKLRRGESRKAHLTRLIEWSRVQAQQRRERPEYPAGALAGDVPTGTHMFSREQVLSSEPASIIKSYAHTRLIVVDLQCDKRRSLEQIERLIDLAREEAGLKIKPGRGRRPKKPHNGKPRREIAQILHTFTDHHVVPLWDLQLAGLATKGMKQAIATSLYSGGGAGSISERGSLYDKLDQALVLQRDAAGWAPWLNSSVG